MGDLEAHVMRAQFDDHRLSGKCKCDPCRQDRLAGCTNPYSCASAAARLLAKLPPKWNPCFSVEDDPEAPEELGGEVGGDIMENLTFTPNLMVQGDLSEGFQVFTGP